MDVPEHRDEELVTRVFSLPDEVLSFILNMLDVRDGYNF